jgi:APA family basic amino acid/polyamine antiporter
MAEQSVFIRTTSGLVREFGVLDILLMMSIGIFALQSSTLQFPWFYGFNPGASLPLALALTLIPTGLLMIIYWAIGVIMPRSGSDYVWVARITHPAVGFAWSLVYLVGMMMVGYVITASTQVYLISSELTVWAVLYNIPSLVTLGTWLTSPLGSWVFGALITVVYGLLAIFGARATKTILYLSWAFAVAALILMSGLLLSVNPTTFAVKWNNIFAQYATYQKIFDIAGSNGLSSTALNFSIGATLGSLPLAMLFLMGGAWGNMVAGEIRNVKRSLPLALMLSMFLGFGIWILVSTSTISAVGERWMTALGYLWDNVPSAYPLPYAPTQPMLLALIAYPNQALVFLILFLFYVGNIAQPYVFLIFPTRMFFGWSFDRVIPTKFADVNKRFRTPHYAIIATGIVAVILLTLFSVPGYAPAFAVSTFIQLAAWTVIALTVAVFPYVRKDLLELAPPFMRKRVAGIPAISMIGIVTMILFALVSAEELINPLVTPSATLAAELIVPIVILGFVIYYASVAYHKGRGVDMQLAFKEIPPV